MFFWKEQLFVHSSDSHQKQNTISTLERPGNNTVSNLLFSSQDTLPNLSKWDLFPLQPFRVFFQPCHVWFCAGVSNGHKQNADRKYLLKPALKTQSWSTVLWILCLFLQYSYLLYVYILCWWGLIDRVGFWLLGGSYLGSWSTLGPPYSLTGSPQTHTHQQDHCQHATPHCSHPSTDTTTLKNYCSALCTPSSFCLPNLCFFSVL